MSDNESKKVLPLFGDDSRMMRRWASNPMVREAGTIEEKRKVAGYLEWARVDALWGQEIRREEAARLAAEKTFWGWIATTSWTMLAAILFFLTETCWDAVEPRWKLWRRRRRIAKRRK
jgi:hypothetical protein